MAKTRAALQKDIVSPAGANEIFKMLIPGKSGISFVYSHHNRLIHFMMKKRKVAVVVTARPSYSRVKTAIQAIERHPDLELQLVVSGSAKVKENLATTNP